MRLDASGNLLLGATNISSARGGVGTKQLIKFGASQQYLELQANTTSTNAGLLFSDASTGNFGLVNYTNTDNMEFYTAAAERMRIFSTGNVLINTTTDAGYKLDVNGTARVVTSIEVNSKTLGGGASALATNTAYGQNTLTALSANGYNTAIGYIALQSNTGAINTAVGAYALNQNSSGTQNVALGGYAGSSITSGGNNVVIGYNAQLGSGGQSNEIVIGYNAVGLGSNTTVIGNSSTTFGRWWVIYL
jgi:hypothetical protein